MKENGIIRPYLNYFGCLLFGVYVVDTLIPNLSKAGFFDSFLYTGLKTYTGALLGSCIYKLHFENCRINTCLWCNNNASDSDSGTESD